MAKESVLVKTAKAVWQHTLGRRALLPEEVQANTALAEPVRAPSGAPSFRYDEVENALDLGWYYSQGRDEFQMAKVAQKDRATHMYVIGATGSGKTKFLEFLIQQDISLGNAFGVIDPHGDLVEDIKGFLAAYAAHGGSRSRLERVVLLDPTDPKSTVTFNPLEPLPGVSAAEQAQELISSFRKIWADSWGTRMEDLLRNALIALGEAGLTLVELPSFLTYQGFRRQVLDKVRHPIARAYFQRFEAQTERARLTWVEPVMNKVNALLADERVQLLFASPKSTFNFREVMDEGRVLLVKLDKGRLKDAADLLGSLLVAKIKMAAFSRSDVPQSRRRPFYLYVDEFQNFATDSFGVILSEARKYGLSLVMAHQTLAQLPEELRAVVLGNTGLQAYFRISRHDAQLLAKEAFRYSGREVKGVHGGRLQYWSLGEEWELHTEELQDLPPRCAYLKHMVQGGIIPIRAVDIEPACELLGMAEEEFADHLASLPIGAEALRPKEDVLLEVQERQRAIEAAARQSSEDAQDGTAARGVSPRARKRSGTQPKAVEAAAEIPGHVADALPDAEPTGTSTNGHAVEERQAAVKEPEKAARGIKKGPKAAGAGQRDTSQHRYLQTLIKQVAQSRGYRATVEEPTPDGQGKVDVGLQRNGRKLACEVSVTTGEDHELANIQKCLRAGYETVVLCSAQRTILQKVQRRVARELPDADRDRVKFLLPEELFAYLEEQAAQDEGREETVKGYRVRVQYQPVPDQEKESKREAVAGVVAHALRRLKDRE